MHKKVGYAELLNCSLRSEKLLARRNSARMEKLKSFLEQHNHASQWSLCIAAITDAVKQDIVPSNDMLCDAIRRCGLREKLDIAQKLYTDFHREIKRPRSLQTHVAYMAACADCGDFWEAHQQFVRLHKRDTALLQKNTMHTPVINDELMSEYLRAALFASKCNGGKTYAGEETAVFYNKKEKNNDAVESKLPWAMALMSFMGLCRDTGVFSKHNLLTPIIIERVTQLWEVGGKWEKCLRFLHYCGQQNVLIPPEAYDAGIRLCYQHGRFVNVVEQMRRMFATRSPPDEQSVRLALISCEETTALQKTALMQHSTDWALAVSLFYAMRNNVVTMYQQDYESPLRSCVMAGRWEDAMRVLSYMKRDNRPISLQLYRLVLAGRIESCESFEDAQRFAQMQFMQNGGIVLYMALLRCCMKIRDWKNFDRLNKEMRDREFPETFDKMLLLIEAAYMREQWHGVLMRFARFENITSYEKKRVIKDRLVRLYTEDFEIPDKFLDMVIESYEHLKNHKDPVVHTAYRAAMKRKARGKEQLASSSVQDAFVPPQEWMFSQEERDKKTPSKHF